MIVGWPPLQYSAPSVGSSGNGIYGKKKARTNLWRYLTLELLIQWSYPVIHVLKRIQQMSKPRIYILYHVKFWKIYLLYCRSFFSSCIIIIMFWTRFCNVEIWTLLPICRKVLVPRSSKKWFFAEMKINFNLFYFLIKGCCIYQ